MAQSNTAHESLGLAMQKLARSQARTYTLKLHRNQAGVCPLCTKGIDLTIKGEAVLDHNHSTGEIRGVLHRSCNAALGKVDNAAGRWGAKSMKYEDILPWLEAMLEYYKSPGTGVMYHLHKTSDEKRMTRNKAVREARAAKMARIRMGNQNGNTDN